MRSAWWLVAVAALGPLGYAACGSSGGSAVVAACDAPTEAPSLGACWMPPATTGVGGSSGVGGHSGTGGNAGTGGGAGVGGGSSADGGAGLDAGAACPVTFGISDCTACVAEQCCTELQPCAAQGTCLNYFSGETPAVALYEEAATKPLVDALYACSVARCAARCAPVPCNPVTSAPCKAGTPTAEGPTGAWQCDVAGSASATPHLLPSMVGNGVVDFVCWPPPNTQAECQTCRTFQGPYCQPGFTCLPEGYCAKYCCDDGDCGTGYCDKTTYDRAQISDPNIGVCIKTSAKE